MPVYDKRAIYRPLGALVLAAIREVMLITTPHDHAAFRALPGDGSDPGTTIVYAVQPGRTELALAYHIGGTSSYRAATVRRRVRILERADLRGGRA